LQSLLRSQPILDLFLVAYFNLNKYTLLINSCFLISKGYRFVFQNYKSMCFNIINLAPLPQLVISSQKNNIFISVVDFDLRLLRSVSLGHLEGRRVNKSILRQRYFIMHKLGVLVGEFMASLFKKKTKKNKKSRLRYFKYFRIINHLVYKKLFYYRFFNYYFPFFLNFYYLILFCFPNLSSHSSIMQLNIFKCVHVSRLYLVNTLLGFVCNSFSLVRWYLQFFSFFLFFFLPFVLNFSFFCIILHFFNFYLISQILRKNR